MIIPKINFPFYGIIIVLSVVIGMLYIFLMLKDEIKKNYQILLFYIMYFTFSFVFGKLYTMICTDNSNILTAGLSAYGGLIGVIVAAIIFEKIISVDNKLIKYSIISLPLVYSLTKVGCFISGCCGGVLYNGFFKVIYTNGLNTYQFPIQIVETISFMILFLIGHKFKNNHNISYIILILISVVKFSLDFLRYDHMNIIITKNQYFSLILLLITIIAFIKRKKINNGNY